MVSAAASRRLFLDGFWLGMILKGLERERDWCEPPEAEVEVWLKRMQFFFEFDLANSRTVKEVQLSAHVSSVQDFIREGATESVHFAAILQVIKTSGILC